MTFDDYGPYRGHPQDPRTPDDDRAFDELTTAEQRAALGELSRADLIQQCVDALDDARVYYRSLQHEQRARVLAQTRMRESAELLNQARKQLAAAVESEQRACYSPWVPA